MRAFLFLLLYIFLRPFAYADTLSSVALHQNLNAPLPLNVVFYNENGQKTTLKQYFKDKPVLITFIYDGCSMLCPLNLKAIAETLKNIDFKPAKDYQFLAISFDPTDVGRDQKSERLKFLKMLSPNFNDGIHFLTGTENSIRAITQAAGFAYAKDEDTAQYAHATILLVATAHGRIARYFFGITYSPRDIKLGITEAGQNKTGSLAQAILLYCFHYWPKTGRYTLAVLNLLKVAALIFIVVLGIVIYLLTKPSSGAPL